MTTNIIHKTCIYGAGAIGSWIGAGLAAAGAQVSVVARGATLQSIQSHGLRIRRGDAVSAYPVTASANPADLGVQDLLVIAVKAPALADIAAKVAPLIGPKTLVLTAMNGVPWWFFQGFGGKLAGTRLKAVDPQGTIEAAFPAANLIGCVVHSSCSVPEPGLVHQHFGNGLIIGELSARASTPPSRRKSRKTSGTNCGAICRSTR